MKTSLATKVGEHQLTVTAALFDVNDTAGALLAFRGWALHDVKALAFRKQPLPELNEFMEYGQPRFTHPVKEMDGGFLSRPGYYIKLAWQPPMPVRVEAIHYDNGSDPEAVNAEHGMGLEDAVRQCRAGRRPRPLHPAPRPGNARARADGT